MRALASLSLGALVLLGASRAGAAECDQASGFCAVGTAALRGAIAKKLGSEIDSGEMSKKIVGVEVKLRTRFTIEPVGTDPLLHVEMPSGAVVEATWGSEKGMITLSTITRDAQPGSVNVRYQLVPSLEGSIAGIQFRRNASELLAEVGGSFKYDERAESTIRPWGFDGAEVETPAPALEDSTLVSMPFSSLGVDIDGNLAVQAAASPVFAYRTTEVRFDRASVVAGGTSTQIPAGDADALDVTAQVLGELRVRGNVEVGPAVSVYGVPVSFAVVKKDIDGAPDDVTFDSATIHIPLPNVKVPTAPLGFGKVSGGKSKSKTIEIQSTGELGSVLTFTSSNKQFSVPKGTVRVEPRSTYQLEVEFEPDDDGAASGTITVKSNDPDSPEQTFKVGANGAEGSEDPDDAASEPEALESGCSMGPRGGSFGLGALGLALLGLRRRRRAA